MSNETDKNRWPAWCNGPDGETEIVNSPEELPEGWYHPRLDKKPVEKKLKKADKPLDL